MDTAPSVDDGDTAPSITARQATAVGLLGALIGFVGAWRPSYWYDEAASLSAVDRSPGELWDLLANVDVVHGAYYYALHGWVEVFGTSATAARMLSAVGLGVTCAGITILGQCLGGRDLGIAAGLISTVLPGLSWTGAEVREYSWSAALAVLAAILLHSALVSRRAASWAAYSVVIAVAIYVFLLSILLIPAHLLTLLHLRLPQRSWWIAVGAGLAACSPLLYAAAAQKEQISWIHNGTLEMFGKAALRQVFLGRAEFGFGIVLSSAVLLMVLSFGLVVAAVVGQTRDESTRITLAVAIPWTVLPTVVLVGYSLVHAQIYQERYVAYSAPGLVLLLGLGLLHLRHRRCVFVTACVLLALLPLPVLVQQKSEAAKGGENYARMAQFIGPRGPGIEGVIYGRSDARSIRVAYPHHFRQVEELNLRRGPIASDSLWGRLRRTRSLDPRSVVNTRVGLILRSDLPMAQSEHAQWLEEQGCSVVDSEGGPRFTVYVLAC